MVLGCRTHKLFLNMDKEPTTSKKPVEIFHLDNTDGKFVYEKDIPSAIKLNSSPFLMDKRNYLQLNAEEREKFQQMVARGDFRMVRKSDEVGCVLKMLKLELPILNLFNQDKSITFKQFSSSIKGYGTALHSHFNVVDCSVNPHKCIKNLGSVENKPTLLLDQVNLYLKRQSCPYRLKNIEFIVILGELVMFATGMNMNLEWSLKYIYSGLQLKMPLATGAFVFYYKNKTTKQTYVSCRVVSVLLQTLDCIRGYENEETKEKRVLLGEIEKKYLEKV